MPPLNIPHERLLRQRIAGAGLERAADTVRYMGAVQAQDYTAAKWAVGLRTRGCTDADVESAFSRGEIIRTHVMRPTWHFVAPEDLRWMQMLTSRRVNAAMTSQYRLNNLDEAVFKKARAAAEKALRDGKQLTRTELATALDRAGIAANGIGLAHILARLELDLVLCSGGRHGKQFTYALVDERVAPADGISRDEAMARLTERYFVSHGPATLRDYAWWSGLTMTEAKQGLEMVKPHLVHETFDGSEYWMSQAAPAAASPHAATYLLGNYDEYIVGYADRRAIFDDAHLTHLDARRNPLFNHTIVSRGHIVGTWKRDIKAGSLSLEAGFFAEPSPAELRALAQAAKRLARFLGLKLADLRLQQ